MQQSAVGSRINERSASIYSGTLRTAQPAVGTASADVRRQITVRLSCRYRAPAGVLPNLALLTAGSERAHAMIGGALQLAF